MSFRSAAAKAGLFALSLAALPAVGCGSSSGGSPDGGAAGTPDSGIPLRPDAASIKPAAEGGTEASLSSQYDGTTGNPCTSDLDCQPAGGPGLTVCSSSLQNPVFPTPVCVLTSCDPGTDNLIHYCDGPDDPSSPGVCLAVSGGGICVPQCAFLSDGSAAQGCHGNDACSFYGAGLDTTTNQLVGIGYCWGACTADSQCPTGSSCQVNQGVCLTTVSPPTKTVGQACTAADNSVGGACSCITNPSNTSTSAPGVCTQTCLVNTTTDACPSGYVCQTFEPNTLTDPTTNQSVTGFTTQNTGLLGLCVATCTAGDAGGGGGAEADASSDEGGTTTSDASTGGGTPTGGACPASTMCDTSTAAGATCLP
jgi:hypothetical protein